MVKGKNIRISLSLFLITGIICGFVAGIVALDILVSYRLEQYLKEIKYLESVIEDKDIKLKKLEESINKNKFILKDIEVFIISEEDDDEIERITLEKHIKEKYNQLIGSEVKKIDVNLVFQVVDNRIYKIDDREYKLKVQKIMLAEVLSIWVDIEVIS